MYAIFAVMVVVLPVACACEDQLGGLGVFDGFKLAGF